MRTHSAALAAIVLSLGVGGCTNSGNAGVLVLSIAITSR